ncbi:MAG: N-acetylneuraminate synthase family protein [Phycisphaerae bacterium]
MSDTTVPADSSSPVSLGRHRIGAGQPVLLIAEAGVNHNGSVETALRMVDAAKQAGADAVKFQMFRAADLVTGAAPTAAYQNRATGESSQRVMLSRLELSLDYFRRIKEHCDSRAITFLATPFGDTDVANLVKLGACALKIASTDLASGPLLMAAAKTGLPIVLSTGASREEEIRAAVTQLSDAGAAKRLVLLHCVSCYPAPVEALNLRAIASLRRAFGVPCGFSDHTRSTHTGAWAVAAGACVLEKHFTLDPAAPGPDHAVSLNPDEMAEYIADVRRVETALGDGRLGMADCETPVRSVGTKSIVAARDIPIGTRITPDMLTLKRPGTGIPAARLEDVTGRRAAVAIQNDTLVAWEMIR